MLGIDILVDRSFWLLPAAFGLWIGYQAGFDAGIRMAVLILGVFVCVLGHELTHSVVAQRYGVRVPSITLYPMGGVASLLRIPKRPGQEFWIAIAGPLFNFALAAALYYPLLSWLGAEVLFDPSLESWPKTLANLFWVNPILGAFNLIPAFPMDGGRMLRSLLALKMSYLTATRISVFLGRIFAILFFILGAWQHAWMLMLVGMYVYFAAGREWRRAVWEEAT